MSNRLNEAPLLGPLGVASHLHLIERHTAAISRLARYGLAGHGRADNARPVQLVYDAHCSVAALSEILPPFRRTVEWYDNLGSALSTGELGLRSTRLVVRELVEPANRLIQEHKVKSIVGAVFQRLLTDLRKRVDEIDEIWMSHRKHESAQGVRQLHDAIEDAWQVWGTVRENTHLITILQIALSMYTNRHLKARCEALLWILNCHIFDERDEGVRSLIDRVLLSTSTPSSACNIAVAL